MDVFWKYLFMAVCAQCIVSSSATLTLMDIANTTQVVKEDCLFGDLIGSSCYHIIRAEIFTWGEAQSVCQAFGGYLAAFETRDEYLAIASHLLQVDFKRQVYWIGLRREEGTFSWVSNGQAPSYDSWFMGTKVQSCATMGNQFYYTYMAWKGTDCSYDRGAICEIP